MSSVNDKVTRKPAHLYAHAKTGKKTNLSLHPIYRLFIEIPNTGITRVPFMSILCIPGVETGASSILVSTSPTKLWFQALQEPSGMSLKFLVEKSLQYTVFKRSSSPGGAQERSWQRLQLPSITAHSLLHPACETKTTRQPWFRKTWSTRPFFWQALSTLLKSFPSSPGKPMAIFHFSFN